MPSRQAHKSYLQIRTLRLGHGARLSVLVWILVVGAVLFSTPVSAASDSSNGSEEAEPRRLTLQQAIGTALEKNESIQDAELDVVQKRIARRSSTAQMGPSLQVESTVSRYDQAQTADFSGTELTVQEQTTASVTLTAAQPLTPLWSLYEAQRIEKYDLKQAKTAFTGTRRDVSLQVVTAYFRLLQARALKDVAAQSLERRQQQLDRAQKFYEAELAPQNDVLRAEVGVSRARQQLIEAEGQVEVASAQLARTIGVSQHRPIVPTYTPNETYSPPATVNEAVETGLTSRTDLTRAELRIDQAQTGVRAARSQLIPQVTALASYRRNVGSTLSNNETFFVGANLSWTFWQWGAKSFEIERARVQKERAQVGRRRLKRGIELEIRQAYTSFQTSQQSLEVARQAARQAKENFRAEERRYEEQLSTTIDLLEAETQLTETRTNLQNAKYELRISAATLRRALGRSPTAAPVGHDSNPGE